MSFGPRLRKGSRRRKRSASVAAKANPYASRDIDKYKVVHEELQAQRAQFASEKGVSVELVRFLSRSSRGWVHLPPSDTPSAASTPRRSHDGSSVTVISVAPDVSVESPRPILPFVSLPALPNGAPASPGSGEKAEGGVRQGAAEPCFVGSGGVMGADRKGDSRNLGRLIVSRKLKDEAWLQISKTAAVLFVKVLVFSRALGASTAFAVTVAVVGDIWNRGRSTLQRVFSVLATELLTTLKPYLSLQQLSKPPTSLIRAAPPRPAPQPSGPEQISGVNAMKVSPVTEDSDAQGSSCLVLPLLAKEPASTTSQRFPVRQRQSDSSLTGSSPEETSSTPSPLVESNKLPSTAKSCALKSKLFKYSPARKGENSSPSAEAGLSNDVPSSSTGSSCNVSAVDGKGSNKTFSCTSRAPISGSEEGYYEVDQPMSSLKPPKKITRSHELLFFRSPNNNRKREIAAAKDLSASAGVKSLSRSQELRFSLKNLGRKKVSRSQEFTSSSPSFPLQELALPKSTVEGLEALAFPFKAEETGQLQHERRSLPCSPRSSSVSKTRRRSTLSRPVTVDPSCEKYSSRGMESPTRSSASSGGVKSKTVTASASATFVTSSKSSSAMLAAAELKPKLRKVKTALNAPGGAEHHDLRRVKSSVIQTHPLPSQAGELGRSQVLSREILGSILLLAILASLLLGRIPAILFTSCLCLVLSRLRRFFHKHLTPRDIELLKRGSGISRLHHANSSAAQLPNSNHSNPLHEKLGLQSSEYRKRVLIEGLLDRGNRRGA